MIIVLFGVAGSGKTTIGRLLAGELAWAFHDADDYHPPSNVRKMRAGIALSDEDRRPWLAMIRELILRTLAEGGNAVVACSALTRAHRDYLRESGVEFVYLKGGHDILRERLAQRRGHFFSPDLLASQLQAFEDPRGGVSVDVDQPPASVVREILGCLNLRRPAEKTTPCTSGH